MQIVSSYPIDKKKNLAQVPQMRKIALINLIGICTENVTIHYIDPRSKPFN